jgi:hypothetical protein
MSVYQQLSNKEMNHSAVIAVSNEAIELAGQQDVIEDQAIKYTIHVLADSGYRPEEIRYEYTGTVSIS